MFCEYCFCYTYNLEYHNSTDKHKLNVAKTIS